MRITRTWRTAVVAAAALGLIGLVSVAWAQGPGGPGWGRRMGPAMGMMPGVMLPLRAANLTDAQRTQVRTLMEQYRTTWGPQLGPALKAVADAIKASPVDEGAIRARCADLAAVQANAAVAAAQLRAQIFALLTPAQQQQVLQAEAQMEQRMEQRRQRRQQKTPGGER
ncbi:MAG: periplasmic heavy metal sensor [Acidobacteriota bacterium]|nr:periplasmic heavy metal sensor [Acidobacteriota bacterium]